VSAGEEGGLDRWPESGAMDARPAALEAAGFLKWTAGEARTTSQRAASDGGRFGYAAASFTFFSFLFCFVCVIIIFD